MNILELAALAASIETAAVRLVTYVPHSYDSRRGNNYHARCAYQHVTRPNWGEGTMFEFILLAEPHTNVSYICWGCNRYTDDPINFDSAIYLEL